MKPVLSLPPIRRKVENGHAVYSRFFAPAILLPVFFLVSGTLAQAQTMDALDKRGVFDFEQCANACQIELDKQIFTCMSYRKDEVKDQPEDCPEKAYEVYETCLVNCPVDPRKRK